MNRQKTVEKMLKALKLDSKEIETLEKVVALEDDKERICSVEIGLPETMDYINLLEEEVRFRADVFVDEKKWFRDRFELKDYLEKHSFKVYDIDDEQKLQFHCEVEGLTYSVSFFAHKR